MHHYYCFFPPRVLKVGQDCHGAYSWFCARWMMFQFNFFLEKQIVQSLQPSFCSLLLLCAHKFCKFDNFPSQVAYHLWSNVQVTHGWGQNDFWKKFLKSCHKIKIWLLSHNFQCDIKLFDQTSFSPQNLVTIVQVTILYKIKQNIQNISTLDLSLIW